MLSTEKTLWAQEISSDQLKHKQALPKDVDVIIVGAGISGMTTAALLAKAGKRVAVLEMAAELGAGDTGKTTAHITQFFDTGFALMRKNFGDDAARSVAEGLGQAIGTIETFCADGAGQDGDCAFERVPAYLYAGSKAEAREVEDEALAMEALGLNVARVAQTPLPYTTGAALRLDGQAQFQPLAYLRQLMRVIVGHGGTVSTDVRFERAQEADNAVTVFTSRGEMHARHLVLATHTPPNKLTLQLKLSPMRSYVLALRCKEPFPAGLFYDTAEPYHYLRRHRHAGSEVVIVGGADHRAGGTEGQGDPFEPLETFARKHLQVEEVVAAWSGIVYEPADGVPFVGLNPGTERTYVISGLSGDGMSAGTMGAQVVADTILGKLSALAEVLAPSRIKPVAQASEWAKHNVAVSSHMVGDRIKAWLQSAPVGPGEGKVMRQGAHVAAAYNDGKKTHVVSPVCPHAGCYVQFNNAEKTWDCPCHGSRFSGAGKLMSGPAVSDLPAIDG